MNTRTNEFGAAGVIVWNPGQVFEIGHRLRDQVNSDIDVGAGGQGGGERLAVDHRICLRTGALYVSLQVHLHGGLP